MNTEVALLDILKYTNSDYLLSKQIDILEYSINNQSNDISGSAINEIKGLKYILHRHKKILCTYIPNTNHQSFSIIWTCSKIKKYKRKLQINNNIIIHLKNCILNKDIKYAAVLLSIRYDTCKANEDIRSHANVLIYNKMNNTIERFDPIGGFRSAYDNKKLDKKLSVFFGNYGIIYKSPDEFCPRLSFQKLQSKEKEFKFGLCAAWSLWFLDFKLSNDNITDSKELINLALTKLNEPNSKSLTTFILNYIRFILYN